VEEIIIIGSGTGIPSLRRGSPGLVLVADQARILIDSGPGALRRMLEVGLTYRDIDLLLYTHIHPDHTADLVPFLFACKYADLPRDRDLVCAGGPGFVKHFDVLKGVFGRWIDPVSYSFTVREISTDPFIFRDVGITAKPVAHLRESVGYRFEFKSGRSVAVSGDTDYCTNMVELAEGVDLLVLECSFPEGKKVEGHLTPSLAARIAVESRCRRLVLTHFYPVCDQVDLLKQCRGTYQGELILAEDLMRIQI